MERVRVTHFTDPGCPWAYSASPALAALRWRYGRQLAWRHVMIGLTERAAQYEERGYTPLWMARSQRQFRRFGMPLAPQPKQRVAGTSLACRALIAVRMRHPHLEWAALRALQLGQFCTPLLLDEPDDLRRALSVLEAIDADEVVDGLESAEVWQTYERERAEARRAAGTPAEAQGKTADTDGAVRFTAPSLIFEADGRRAMAAGFQSLAVYDALLANLRPGLARRAAPEDLGELLGAFPEGLTTAEVAAINGADEPTALQPGSIRAEAEDALLGLAAAGTAIRQTVGDGALWSRPDDGLHLAAIADELAAAR